MIKCVVPISGGKDSQTCLALAVKEFGCESVIGLFCDTQFEHPATYSHVKHMAQLYSVEIITRCNGDVLSLCEKTRRFPSGIARFCTNELKINVSKQFYKQLAEQQGQGFEVWYGMRSGESHERAKRYQGKLDSELYDPHEIMPSNYPKYLAKLGVKFRLPILDWSAQEVLDYLGDDINPLYKSGFDRVGCFPCLAGGGINGKRKHLASTTSEDDNILRLKKSRRKLENEFIQAKGLRQEMTNFAQFVKFNNQAEE